ncbi:MAG: apolipoprotein N-acyltransferase [Phycisphaerales bacterium]|nr:apolipoprotein N-acyltransferase [Phycisphaerales bacterium]
MRALRWVFRKAVGFVRGWWFSVLCVVLTWGLLVLSFAPFNAWPVAYIALVPWLVVVGRAESARRVYVLSYLMGAAFFCTSIYWLFLVTGLGAGVLFSVFAVHFPIIACPVRHLVRRRHWPLAFTFPFIWVGSEAVRSMFLLEFPWNLLGHSQHGLLTMIQVSDLVGAYGVSFVVATVNGAIADLVISRWFKPIAPDTPAAKRAWRPSMVFASVVVLATIVYGVVQLRRGSTTMHDGPKVAVLQGNYPNYVDMSAHPGSASPRQRARRYFDLLDEAEAEGPDLFLLPETPWYMYLNHEYLGSVEPDESALAEWSHACYDAFRERATTYGAYVVTGSASVEPTPLDLRTNERRYNSAFVFPPDGAQAQRYDKIHMVMIGEYVPFRYGPLRFIYLWINRIGPFYSEEYEYSLSPGSEFRTFEMTTPDGKKYGFATPICYENVMPYVSRTFVIDKDGKKRCDFLLNMSNDGWFLHTSELPQHLAATVFRAVENRVGIARAVNTGISCFVDPDGRVHDLVEVNGRTVGPNIDGFRVSRVKVDDRRSLYSRWGDWFALACAVLWGLFYLDYVVARSLAQRRRRESAACSARHT